MELKPTLDSPVGTVGQERFKIKFKSEMDELRCDIISPCSTLRRCSDRDRKRTRLEPYNFVSFPIPIKFRRKNVNKNTKISPLSASKQVTSRRVIK